MKVSGGDGQKTGGGTGPYRIFVFYLFIYLYICDILVTLVYPL